MTKKTRMRRLRRTTKQVLAHGKHAKRSHTRRGGRTGSVFSRQVQPREKK